MSCVTVTFGLFILAILSLSVNCAYAKPKCNRSGNMIDANSNVVIDEKEACESKPCVTKCCGIDHFIFVNKTSNAFGCLHRDKFKNYIDVSKIKFDFSDYSIYKSIEETDKSKSDKDFFKDFRVLVNTNFLLKGCKIKLNETRMLENGRIYQLDYKRKSKKANLPLLISEYCVDKFIFQKISSKKTMFRYVVFNLLKFRERTDKGSSVFDVVALLISAFSMALVLLVYSILKQLRNIQGMILMGYIATFLISSVLRAASILGLAIDKLGRKNCKYLTPFSYGFCLSMVFWMNVMSFDIWWTFRATRKIRSYHRQGELMKFIWYGLYAWGLPAAITVIAVLIDNADTDNLIRPKFEICMYDDEVIKLYMFAPILIMITVNTVLFLMTTYNLWLINQAISSFDSPSQGTIKTNRNRFWLYVKVSMLMGVSWILELVQKIFKMRGWMATILSIPNLFVGVAIFFVFVFKKAIIIKLCKKFNNKNIPPSLKERNTEHSGSGKCQTRFTESTKAIEDSTKGTNDSTKSTYDSGVSIDSSQTTAV